MSTIWSHPELVKNRFYKEPQRSKVKIVGQCQPMTNSDYTPDELEYERRQKCDMEDGEELPF